MDRRQWDKIAFFFSFDSPQSQTYRILLLRKFVYTLINAGLKISEIMQFDYFIFMDEFFQLSIMIHLLFHSNYDSIWNNYCRGRI